MTQLLVCAAGLLVTLNLCAQGSIVLHDGKKIDYEKFKVYDDHLLVTTKKTKLEVPIENVKGHFTDGENIFYFKKPATDGEEPYQFLQVVREGKINLYKKTVTEYSVRPATSQGPNPDVRVDVDYLFYVEKNEKFEEARLDQKEWIAVLKSYTSDTPAISQTLDENYKLNSENLLKTIRDYNVIHYRPPVKVDTSSFANVVFYRVGKNIATNLTDRIQYSKLSELEIPISICGNTYNLKGYDWVEVKIPPDEQVKVCFGDTESSCDIISASQYFISYFEVGQDKKSNLFSIERKGYDHARPILSKLKDYNKRR